VHNKLKHYEDRSNEDMFSYVETQAGKLNATSNVKRTCD
jgi:hypothetical protein